MKSFAANYEKQFTLYDQLLLVVNTNKIKSFNLKPCHTQ